MQNLVISLTSAQDRREHINREFGKHKVAFEFFDALTPDVAEDYARNIGLNLDAASLTPGELACMMSHVAIWKRVIDEKLPYVTIFEDDVYLGADAERLLKDYDWVKPEWHIIKLEAFNKKTYLANDSQKISNTKRHVVQLKGKNLGTAGYILSHQGAKAYLDYLQKQPLAPLDKMIFDEFIDNGSESVQQLVPALCIQEMLLHKKPTLPSMLLNDRQARMRSEKKKGLAKIRREADRLMTQAKKSVFAKDVPFQ